MLNILQNLTQKSVSTDIDDQSSMLDGWEQDYTQLEAGPFKAQLLSMRVANDVSVFRKLTNRRLNKYFVSPGENLRLAAVLPGSDRAIFQRQEIFAGDLFVIKPNIELELSSHGKFDVAVIELDEQLCFSSNDEIENKNDHIQIVIQKKYSRGYAEKLYKAFLHKRLSEGMLHSIAAPALKALCFESNNSNPKHVDDVVLKAIHFVDDYMEELGEIPKIPDVAASSGVSERALEYAFSRKYGVSPTRYFIFRRLHGARRDIRNRHLTVTDAAMKWGFSHLGRFSGSYRDIFGELPSHTKSCEIVR